MDPQLKIFTIEFEEATYPYHSRSILSRRQPEILPETPEAPEYLLSETEISNSYISAALSTVQPLEKSRSLLVLIITCHPAPGRRFESATITWRITPPVTPPSTPSAKQSPPQHIPKIFALAPQHSVGGWTEEQTKLIWGVSLSAQVGAAGGSVGLDPSVTKETDKAVMHAMTIMGSNRSGGTRATWTVEENKSSQRGIPSHFQLAIVIDHHGPFVMELDIKALLGGRVWSTYVHAKKGSGSNGLKRIIDVEAWKCGDAVEPGEVGWKKYMAAMNGEVPGIMQEFEQKVVRP